MVFYIFAGIFLTVSLVLLGTAILAWVRIESPAVNSFAVVAGTLGTGSFVLACGFVTFSPAFILGTTISVAMVSPIPWIIFSFDYVGKENLISLWITGLLAVPVTVGLSATIAIFASRVLPWFSFLTRENPGRLTIILRNVLELSQWIGILYSGVLVLAGTGLILWTFQRYPHLDSTTGTVLCTFGTVPWISVLFGLILQPVSFFIFSGAVAVGVSVGALAAVGLVGPSALFDRVPAAGNVGPTTVIEELDDAVLIADGEGQVIEKNPSADQLFSPGQDAVSGTIHDLFGCSLEELGDRSPVVIESEMRRDLFDPTVSELTDQYGNLLGYAIVLRDVTEPTIRQQRLEVLNRLLRHNLRNDMTVMLGYLEVIGENVDDPDLNDNIEQIFSTGKGLMDLSQKIRDSEQVLDADTQTYHQIHTEPMARRVFESVESPETAEFNYEGPETVSIISTPHEIEFLLEILIENAVQHNDSNDISVTVRVTHRPEETYPLKIAVIDNGPGIPKQERKVITSGQETSLNHSSGISLWMVRWIVRSQGGTITFDDREPTGTVVKLLFPTGEPDENTQTDTSERLDSSDSANR